MAVKKRKGSDVWADFAREMDELIPRGRMFVVSGAIPLFTESTVAYDAGAFQLTALGCRSAIDSGCHLFLTRRWSDWGWRKEIPRTLDGAIRSVDLEELRKAPAVKEALGTKLLEDVLTIQKDGNLGAHPAKVLDQLNEKATRESISALAKTSRLPSASAVKTAVTQTEALAYLESTAKILLALEKSHPGLQPFAPDPNDYGQG